MHAFAYASLFLVAIIVIVLCQYGFDISDEGYYLLSIAAPENYPYTTTQFGYVFHVFWQLFDQDIPLLRQMNILLLYLLSLWLAYINIYSDLDQKEERRISRFAVSGVLAVSVLGVFYHWLPTPNYNTLNLVGLLLASVGFTYIYSSSAKHTYFGFILVGVAGVIVFLAKPPSAVALIVLFGLFLLRLIWLGRPIAPIIKGLFISMGISILLVSQAAFHISGSIASFVSNVMQSIVWGNTLHGAGRVSTWNFLWKGRLDLNSVSVEVLVFCLGFALMISLQLVRFNRFKPLFARMHSFLCYATVFFVIAVVLLVAADQLPNPLLGMLSTERFLIVYFPLVWIFFIEILLNLSNPGGKRNQSLVLVLSIFCMLYIYTVGTGNTYVNSILLIPFFAYVGIARIVSGRPNSQSVLLMVCTIGFALGFLSMPIGGKQPYRQQLLPSLVEMIEPKETQSDEVQSLGRIKGLRLSSEMNLYLSSLKDAAIESGFRDDTPIIDMTGASPGTVFAIGGRSLGVAWFLGGYEGSNEYAKAVLSDGSIHALRQAWVLTENEGSRKLDDNLLEVIGKDIARDYILVTQAVLPSGYGGRRTDRMQSLYKPKSE